jgi:formylglycine-generating enzyme required for sulfatase activity
MVRPLVNFALALVAPAALAQKPPIEKAGVCSRCHVSSVLEWGASGHSRAGIDCVACHGRSQAHVLDERNNIKPNRIPRGAAIAGLCADCHSGGCPKTRQRAACESCHHAHALVNPRAEAVAADEQLERRFAAWRAYSEQMERGERLLAARDWAAAEKAFQAALALMPGNRLAARKSKLCRRRLNPHFPGFRIEGEEFDEATGLPVRVKVEGLDIEMVLIPGGDVDLGSERFPHSRPVHTVSVEPFYLGKFEVTQEQWERVMGSNPSFHQGPAFAEAPRMPVEQVSWEDCQAFVAALNRRVPGGGFRLPTEAEWELAARGKQGAAPALEDEAWHLANREAVGPRPVGSKAANSWGLFDMRGNVAEWCSSLLRPYPYEDRDGREDPAAPGLRVLRGGSFADAAEALDAAFRHGQRPARRLRWNGMRLARSVPD